MSCIRRDSGPMKLLIIFIFMFHAQAITLYIDKSKIRDVDERYLSLGLDASIIKMDWGALDFRSKHIKTLAQGLSPCYVRVGGTMQDQLVFSAEEGQRQKPPLAKVHDRMSFIDTPQINRMDAAYQKGTQMPLNQPETFIMTGKQLSALMDFAPSVDWHVLFGFNALLRDASGAWNSSNAQQLLAYVAQHGYAPHMGFELGNEPNSFHHKFNESVDASQLAQDFGTLYDLLRNPEHYGGVFQSSLLVGPDVTNPRKQQHWSNSGGDGSYEWRVPSDQYLKEYLPKGKKYIDRITFHHYYIQGSTAVVEDFLSPTVLDSLLVNLQVIQAVMTACNASHIPLWLGETASAYGGGAPRLSDRYADGFLFMNKLGVSAVHGVSVVIRQSFYHGSYGLLDEHLHPNPSYWLSWIYKQLVGTIVLNVTASQHAADAADMENGEDGTAKYTRVFAHCTNTASSSYHEGSVVIYALNVKNKPVHLTLDKPDQLVHEYLLTPSSNSLTDRHVDVNGVTMALQHATLPTLKPRVLTTRSSFTIPAQRFGFWVLPDYRATPCMEL